MLKDKLTAGPEGGKGMQVLSWALVLIILLVIVTVITKVLKAGKLASTTAGDIAGGAIIAAQTGITVDRQNVCREVARDCENAITRLPFVNTIVWVTDDDFVKPLNRLTTGAEAKLASNFFKEISGDSLKSVLEGGFLVESSRQKVNSTIRENLT